MITEIGNDNPKADYLHPEAVICLDSPVSSVAENGQLFVRSASSSRRDTQTSAGSIINPEESRINPEESSINPEESRINPEESRINPEESRINPEESSINPEEESRINPEEESSINPEEESSINPEEESSINPEEESSINPEEESINPEEESIIKPLVSSAAATAAYIMTSGEFTQTGAPLFVQRSRRNVLYKILCFLLLVFQGGVLDFYLIVFTDYFWCSWIATDLVVVSGWGIFFVKNARSKRERACGFHQKSSMFGCNLGEFTYAYLAWLIYVIACTPKVVLVLETSILDLVALKVPFGVTGFKIITLLSAPLLYCLVNSIIEDLNGTTRHRAHGCFVNTCLDLIDSFTLVEMLLRNEIPTLYLKYTVISVYFIALGVPVLWLYELTASEMRRRWVWARFLAGVLVNAPLLVVRCFQVYVYQMPISVFMFKNMFFLACKCLELIEQCVTVRRVRRFASGSSNPAQFSHCVSENDMCPHGYVNTLAVSTQP